MISKCSTSTHFNQEDECQHFIFLTMNNKVTDSFKLKTHALLDKNRLGVDKKIEYKYLSLPKLLEHDLFFLTTETSDFSEKWSRQMSCNVNFKSNFNQCLTMAKL